MVFMHLKDLKDPDTASSVRVLPKVKLDFEARGAGSIELDPLRKKMGYFWVLSRDSEVFSAMAF